MGTRIRRDTGMRNRSLCNSRCLYSERVDRRKVTVKLLGGDLEIEWDREKNKVFMTGPAKVVFDGVWEE